ncbi:MAG: 2OG-Fe(II) oxygenase [Pseudomonadota bacterium]|nr:2OG-Fe(II) oxygenase [Pseudomonadota bacterium]
MLVDLDTFQQTPLSEKPYPHLVVRNFLPPNRLSAAIRDFPTLEVGGLFLPEAAEIGQSVTEIIAELESDAMRAAVGEKLGLDLSDRPTLVTLRNRCNARDGRIHPDSKFKLATMLLYLNEPWAVDGGRLRILNSGSDLEDYAAEVPPNGGTLVCFKVQPNSWHGHKPFVGPRRYIMVNYCQDEAVRDSEAARHRLSTRVKKVRRLFAGADAQTA